MFVSVGLFPSHLFLQPCSFPPTEKGKDTNQYLPKRSLSSISSRKTHYVILLFRHPSGSLPSSAQCDCPSRQSRGVMSRNGDAQFREPPLRLLIATTRSRWWPERGWMGNGFGKRIPDSHSVSLTDWTGIALQSTTPSSTSGTTTARHLATIPPFTIHHHRSNAFHAWFSRFLSGLTQASQARAGPFRRLVRQ